MNSFVVTIADGTGQIWGAALLLAAAAVRIPPRNRRRAAQLDSRTLKDIGVEPGSITWL
jgi:hypothetical protein